MIRFPNRFAEGWFLFFCVTFSSFLHAQQVTPISDATIVVSIPNAEQPDRNGIDRNYVSYEAIKSDSEGNWVFKGAPKEFESVQLGVWSYRHVSGEFFQFQTFQSKEARDGSITLILPRGVSIEGIVLDDDDKPLKGARARYGGGMASNKMDPKLTDEEGKFFYTAKEGETVTLTITAPGHAPELATFMMDDQTHVLTVFMAESQPMFGRIVGPNEEPVPFTWVFPDTWRGSRSLGTRIQADKEGKFIWKDAPGNGAFGLNNTLKQKVEIIAGETATVTLVGEGSVQER